MSVRRWGAAAGPWHLGPAVSRRRPDDAFRPGQAAHHQGSLQSPRLRRQGVVQAFPTQNISTRILLRKRVPESLPRRCYSCSGRDAASRWPQEATRLRRHASASAWQREPLTLSAPPGTEQSHPAGQVRRRAKAPQNASTLTSRATSGSRHEPRRIGFLRTWHRPQNTPDHLRGPQFLLPARTSPGALFDGISICRVSTS